MRNQNLAGGALRTVGRILLIVLVTVLLVAVFLLAIMGILIHGPSSEARRLFVLSVNETSALKFIPHMYLSNEKVEAILHPLIMDRMLRDTEAAHTPIVGWDVPLLFETGMDKLCDEVWCVYITGEEQLRRVMRRDHLPREAAQARIDSQLPMAEKKARADHRISTMGSRAATRHHVHSLLRDLQRRLRHE